LLHRLRERAPLGRAGTAAGAFAKSAPEAGPRRGDDDLNPGFLEPVTAPTPAAVLVPLVRRPEGLNLILTRRTPHLKNHAGQICFPGGRMEPDDATPVDTALREASEEVNLDPARVDLVAELDPYLTRTGYRVTPVVGLFDSPAGLRPEPSEVAEVFEVPLRFVLEPRNRETHSWVVFGQERFYHVFVYGEYYIWGATAGMLVNLTEVVADTC
jgi:8-oxo-dGTP pyrophosphatase MutT (NUDIX family)